MIALVIPLLIQQGITSFVNLLDNVMVGGLGTTAISGVAIVNQLIFVFNLTIFGGMSGASIYGAQFAGNHDNDGVRNTFRFKLLLGTGVLAVGLIVFLCFGRELILLYLNGQGGEEAALNQTLAEAQRYLSIAVWGLLPFMVSQALSSTLRETGETLAPMLTSVLSFLVNLVLNYALIYGKLGCPKLGVAGAAYATVIARYAETLVIILYTVIRRKKFPFICGALRRLRIPAALAKKICITGAPLLFNELLWSIATASINQCYSVRGLGAVAAVNIVSTAWNVFAIVMFSMGSVISILVGQRLGAGDIEGARADDRRLVMLDFLLHIGIGILVIALSRVIPQIYNTEQAVRDTASRMLVVAGLALPLHAVAHAAYFSIRSGGRTMITFLLDSVYTWLVPLPLAFVLSRFTSIDVVAIYAVIQFSDAVKIAVGLPMLLSGRWARNIISVDPAPPQIIDAQQEI